MKEKLEKKLTVPPKLAPFYNKRLKSTGAKVLSASALFSDYTVGIQNILAMYMQILRCINKSSLVEGFDWATRWRCLTCLHHVTFKWRPDSIFTRMFNLLMFNLLMFNLLMFLKNSYSERSMHFLNAVKKQ